MPSEERMLRTLDGSLPADVPALPLGSIDRVTRSRIRHSMAELAAGKIDTVNTWLDQVANGVPGQLGPNPARAIELFVELLQFSTPKVKAVAVDVRSKDGSLARLSMSELANIVSEQ